MRASRGMGIVSPGKLPKNIRRKDSPENVKVYKKGGWISDAIKPGNEGALRAQLGVAKGKKLPIKTLKNAAQKAGKLGQRARLALTLGKLRKR